MAPPSRRGLCNRVKAPVELRSDFEVDAPTLDTLASWGCDAQLWDQIEAKYGWAFKSKLARFAREGDEEKGAELIEVFREAVGQTSRKASKDVVTLETDAATLETLASWGCDEELWKKTEQKRQLARFAEQGKEEEAREMIERIFFAIRGSDPTLLDTLATWGCDADLWEKVHPRRKRKLVRLANDGKEEEARDLITSVRLAIDGVDVATLDTLVSWGCDANLWEKVKPRPKRKLVRLANDGKEEEARDLITSIRFAIDGVDVATLDTLRSWGCDAELWEKAKSKSELAQLAREGKEQEARDLIAFEMSGEADVATLDTLASWGCNADLWEKVGPKRQLARFAKQGKEEEAREMIERILFAIRGADAAALDTLASWGCDAELFEKVTKTKQRNLVRLARWGKEEEAREMIAATREADAAAPDTLA